MYYGGFTYTEARALPIPYRAFFIDQINTEFKKARERGETPPSHAAHDSTPEARQMQGMSRDMTPARVRRFT